MNEESVQKEQDHCIGSILVFICRQSVLKGKEADCVGRLHRIALQSQELII